MSELPPGPLPETPPAPDPTPPEVPIPPVPALRADRLGLRTRRGWVFRDVSAELPEGGLLGIHGPAGSGRSMLLLALAGRAALTTGRLAVAGARRPAEVRRRVGVARIGGAIGLEPGLTVGDHLTECARFGGSVDLGAAAALLRLQVEPSDLVEDLPAVEALLLAVALATATRPSLIVVDDLSAGLTSADCARAHAALGSVTAAGTAVAATDSVPLPGADVLVDLGSGSDGPPLPARRGRHEKE
ncbi:ATP-binding cassette domain-containing protein [Pseudonocardia hispaniensis]|uniref:ATP-binding cassette domain-containing protein n=1 Tax=Pseudonocardia hispaniensis TaxID=904933 RepID=A0ABW1J027_9PSEU